MVETRIIERTVVVTATPIPTPVYVSRVNAISGTLIYPMAAEPITLDPQQASDDAALLVAQQMYEGLYRLRGDGALTPAAAAGYRVSADGQVYTVTLRGGMTWSDGQALTAQHFVDGVCRALRPATGNGYAYLLYETVEVRGARAMAEGDATDCKTVGVKAVDNLTLQIVLERPAAFLPRLFSLPIFWPARLDAFRNPGRGTRAVRSPQSQPPAPTFWPSINPASGSCSPRTRPTGTLRR